MSATPKPTLPDGELHKRHYFSNGAEHEIWSANWCDRCKHDTNGDCAYVLGMLMGIDVPDLVDATAPNGVPTLECRTFTDRGKS